MGKRLLCPLLALLLLLSACGGKSAAAYTLDDAQTLLDAGLFDDSMAQVDTFILCRLYGIDQDTVDSAVGYMATNTSVCADELAVLILTDEDAAIAAETACRSRVESQIQVCQDYAPAAVPRLEGAVVSRLGSTVLLAVGDPDLLPDAVDQLH